MQNIKITAVNVAIIDKSKKVLIAKRPADKPMPNKWEFPGGKLEKNETLHECGVREIKEEMDLDVELDKYLGYEELVFENKDFTLHLFTANLKDHNQAFKLHEHTHGEWVFIDELINYDFPAFDIPFISKLRDILC
ncbi:(deoxy)nucleoside triphosphate pyrophosphohydrolase [Sulfurimonas sp.]|nr:(deoxy)nucleoside triphosphate pyrophosphohydrolase [Sulfurimonas sp.]